MSDHKQAGESEHLYLKVLAQDNSIVEFKVKKYARLRGVLNAYCITTGLAMAALRFRYDGMPINDADTPLSLKMEDHDAIEVFQTLIGG